MVEPAIGYAGTVISQDDRSYPNRTDWTNVNGAVGHVNSTHANGHYYNTKGKINKPHALSCYDFGVKLPQYAVITGIEFVVKMRAVNGLSVNAPNGTFMAFNVQVKDTIDNTGNGWRTHAYRCNPNEKLSKSWKQVHYTMPKKDVEIFNKYSKANQAEVVTKDRFGIVLRSLDSKTTGHIEVAWVQLKVTYDIPTTYIRYKSVSNDENNPTLAYIDEVKEIEIEFGNTSKTASLPEQTLNVDIPYGFEVQGYSYGDSSIYFDEELGWWTVSGKAGSKSTLTLVCVPKAINQKVISIGNDVIQESKGYFNIFGNPPEDWGDGYIEHSTLQQGEKSCVSGYLKWTSQDETANPYLQLGSDNLTENDIISVEVTSDNEDVYLIDYSLQNNRVLFNIHVPSQVDVDMAIHVCYYPRRAGTITLAIPNYFKQADVLEPNQYTLVFNRDNQGNCTNVFELRHHRFITSVDTDLSVIPIRFADTSSNIYVDNSTLKLDQWKKRRYIGCVETEHSHYDPDSTFEDDLLNEHYKNTQYIGKANEYDEDISLKIKLRPWQVPTIQGLIKIDKPIPINLVPTAFEGDPLNHRGWAEITKIKSEKTNPLWYDCEIDVKYITHNIISRFNIFRGDSPNSSKLPSVYQTSLSSGEDIGEFFDVDTDGTYVFDDDEEETQRNLFSISNGQTITLTSKNVLGSKSVVEFYWDTTLFSELRENNISRIVQLIDTEDNVVFEYEHCNFDFTDDLYTCDIIGRVSNENGFVPEINQSDVYLHSDFEFTDDETDEEYDEEDIDVYGSQTRFSLNNNELTIRELGFSGNEFEKTVKLETGSYYFRVIVTNNNNDADTSNVLNWFDFTINELAFNSELSKYYGSLVVSPYPVPNKTIVFTRESEEGTIYYLQDDGGDFKFLLEPFYQYLCGVDLVTSDKISVFDFNNSYPVIYMSNGLIRFGVNRINGDLYLDKWDYESKSFIRTNRFRIIKFDDVETVKIDDDIITIQISDLYVTMWRGRPYVEINHKSDDIEMIDTFNSAFADGINDEVYAYPQKWELVNAKNKLPECIGGTKLIKTSCMELTIDDSTLDDLGDFIIVPSKTDCQLGEEVILTISADVEDGEVSLVINDKVAGTNVGQTITATLSEIGINTIYAVYHGTDTTNMELSNVVNVDVTEASEAEEYEDIHLYPVTQGDYLYNQGEFIFQLIRGVAPYPNRPIDVYTPRQTWHVVSDSITGEAHGAYNRNLPAGTYTITAEAWDNQVLIGSASMKIKIKESTPTIKGSTLSLKAGAKASWRLVDESGQPVPAATVTVKIGGKTYTRTTSAVSQNTAGGYFSVKLSKKGTYTAKVRYAGEKKKYKAVSKSFTVEVK